MNANTTQKANWQKGDSPQQYRTNHLEQACDTLDFAVHQLRRTRKQRDELLKICKAMRLSIRHAQSCRAPEAFPCSCDANSLWEKSEIAIANAQSNP